MNDKDYINSFKRALNGLERPARTEIIAEIESLMNDPAAQGQSLEQRFGSPQELAAQYMDGEKPNKPVVKRVAGIGKKLLMIIGLLVLLLVVLISLMAWYFTKDRFDYANETAPELQEILSTAQTLTPNGPLTVSIDQSSGVFYWHGKPTISLQCNGRPGNAKMVESTLTIQQSQCIIYLPETPVTINAEQAQIVLVRPQADVAITTLQSELRIAENDTSYRYEIAATTSKVAAFESVADAEHTLRINTTESMINPYSY